MKPIGYYNYTVIATYLGLCAAVVGCVYAFEGEPTAALICLMIAGGTDMIDGKIASTMKRTDNEKQFGIQIDSLCDLVSFGVLPAMLLCCFALPGAVRKIAGALFVLTAIIRLGYFNVTEITRQNTTSGRREFYEGLPVTSTALVLPLVYLFEPLLRQTALSFGWVYLFFLLLTGVLFLSPFRLKKPHGKMLLVFALVGVIEFAGLLLI